MFTHRLVSLKPNGNYKFISKLTDAELKILYARGKGVWTVVKYVCNLLMAIVLVENT